MELISASTIKELKIFHLTMLSYTFCSRTSRSPPNRGKGGMLKMNSWQHRSQFLWKEEQNVHEDFGNRKKTRLYNGLQRREGCEDLPAEVGELASTSQPFFWNRNLVVRLIMDLFGVDGGIMGCFLDLEIWIKKPFGHLLLRMWFRYWLSRDIQIHLAVDIFFNLCCL